MPITGSVSVSGSSAKEFAPMPVDVYQFELLDVEAKEGLKWGSEETETKLSFTFVCVEEGQYYGRRVWRNSNTKFVGGTKPSNLYTIVTGITQRQFSKEECANAENVITMDFLNSLIGTQMRLSIGQSVSPTNGKTYNSIQAYLPVKQQLPAFDASKQPVKAEEEIPEV